MLRILLVEDDPDVAFVLSTLLEVAGYHVTVANNGQQGFDIALQEHSELIVTDFMMPIMSGVDMIERLRQQGYTRPIILCSAVAENRVQRNDAGYDAFLLKPYRSEQLIGLIEQLRRNTRS
jgi:CheY-like chemotaxis protein